MRGAVIVVIQYRGQRQRADQVWDEEVEVSLERFEGFRLCQKRVERDICLKWISTAPPAG
jgi:hypothetical protein